MALLTTELLACSIAITWSLFVGSASATFSECHVHRGWRMKKNGDRTVADNYVECMFGCLLKDLSCSGVYYNEATRFCKRLYKETASMIAASDTEVVVLGPNLKAVYATDTLGQFYAYNYTYASDICLGFRGHLMSYAELEASKDIWSSMCWCAWLDDGNSYYLENDSVYDLCTGTKGIHMCNEVLAHAWCAINL